MMMLFCAAMFAALAVVTVRGALLLVSAGLVHQVRRERDAVQASVFYTGLREWAIGWHFIPWGRTALRILQGVRYGTLPATSAVRAAYLDRLPQDQREYWSTVLDGVKDRGEVVDLTVFEKS